MTTDWWLITSAATLGYTVTIWPLWKPMGVRQATDVSLEPTAALLVMAVVLGLAGTSVLGAALSFAAALAAAAITMKLRGRGRS